MFVFQRVKYKNIVDITDLTIKAQAVTFIVGESGSGKTTLLRLLNKMISPDSGEIYYKGEPLSAVDSVSLRRSVVMLSQAPAIFDGSIKDNLLIGLEFACKPSASDDALLEMLKRVNLGKPLNQSAANLSGGEKQRIALGRVLLMNPEVLLLDEPSSSLDEETETLIFDVLTDYTRKNNRTMICVSHSKKKAACCADHIFEIKSRRAQEAAL
jgi:putative ABC transport system ATP-binding protein